MWLATLPAGAQTPAQDPPAPVLQLTQATLLLDDGEAIPADNAAWQPQTLPDNWNRSRPGVGGFAWYRIEFELPADRRELSALYIPRLSMKGSVAVNGEVLGGDGNYAEPMTRQWYRPQLLVVPQKLLKSGTNVIHIRLKTYVNNKGGLSEMVFGGYTAIEPLWRDRFFWQIIGVQISSAITLGVSVLALTAWALLGRTAAYGYFGAAALLWAARNTNFLVTEIPIPAFLWEILVASSLIWVMTLVFMFVLRFAGQNYPKTVRLIWTLALALPVGMWLAGPVRLTLAIGVSYGLLIFIGAYILKVLLDVARRERTLSTALLFAASLVVYGLAAHDWTVQREFLGFSQPFNLHFGSPILFIVVAFNMFQRFVDAQKQTQSLTLSLEDRIAQKTRELEHSHQQLRAIEATRAQALERGRIMQDMHDGLGSQLVSSLAMAQSGELSSAQTYDLLRSCIDDLRLAIDSSTDSRDSLALALGNLRFRMEPRLKAAGIALKWNTLALQDDLLLPVEKQLPILRVMQETITNTLKHAQAKTLNITVSSSATTLVVEISDDGHGFDVAAATQTATGKGLNSLDKRARVLGATLLIDSSEHGTLTHLALPLLEET